MANLRKNILDIGGEITVSRTNCDMLVSALGYSSKTKQVAIYSLLLTLKEPISGMSLDNLQSGNFTINPVKASNGVNVAPTVTDEEDPNAEFSFSMKEDLNFVRENAPFGVNRSVLNAVLKGESFKIGDEIITIVGTNGTMKSETSRAKKKEMALPFKAMFGLEGDYIKVTGAVNPETGEIQTKRNAFRSAYDTFNKTLCIELRTTNGGKQYVDVMPLIAITSMTKDEADANMYNVQGNRLCDVWTRDDFIIEVGETTDMTKDVLYSEIVVDAIVVGSASEPTISGTTNPLLCKVSTGGVIEFKQNTKTLKGKLKPNTRISARKLCLSGSDITEQNGFVVVAETNGTDLTGSKAVEFSLGSGTKNYVCKVNTYNRDTQEMEAYQTQDYV